MADDWFRTPVGTEKRNKGKDKKKSRKKHPYRKGGRNRSIELKESKKSDGGKKPKKKSKKKRK